MITLYLSQIDVVGTPSDLRFLTSSHFDRSAVGARMRDAYSIRRRSVPAERTWNLQSYRNAWLPAFFGLIRSWWYEGL